MAVNYLLNYTSLLTPDPQKSIQLDIQNSSKSFHDHYLKTMAQDLDQYHSVNSSTADYSYLDNSIPNLFYLIGMSYLETVFIHW